MSEITQHDLDAYHIMSLLLDRESEARQNLVLQQEICKLQVENARLAGIVTARDLADKSREVSAVESNLNALVQKLKTKYNITEHDKINWENGQIEKAGSPSEQAEAESETGTAAPGPGGTEVPGHAVGGVSAE